MDTGEDATDATRRRIAESAAAMPWAKDITVIPFPAPAPFPEFALS